MVKKLRLSRTTIVICIVILVAIGFSVTNLYFSYRVIQEETLIFQLKQLRTGVQIALKLEGRLPKSLANVVDMPFRVGARVEWKIKRDVTGKLLDPFGNPFAYDSVTGWVSSPTAGYESW